MGSDRMVRFSYFFQDQKLKISIKLTYLIVGLKKYPRLLHRLLVMNGAGEQLEQIQSAICPVMVLKFIFGNPKIMVNHYELVVLKVEIIILTTK